jgi:cytochrome c biogenesis protein CcmG/thiol:disulfide interchange protein DsbE
VVAGRAGSRLHLLLQAFALSLVALLMALLGMHLVSNGRGRVLDEALTAGRAPAAPAFSLPRLGGGGSLTLRSLRGKAVVLNFWASWCVPCKQEAPLLEAAARAYRAAGVVVVGIDAQDFSRDARRFMHRHRLTYPLVRDGEGSTLTRYDVTGFPETWFVDRAGRVVGEHVKGPLTREQLASNIEVAMRR